MESFSQRDPRWANLKIKGTNISLGQNGCLITCIADLSTYFGDNLTPDEVNNALQFTPSGLVIWASAKFGHFVFVKRERMRNDLGIAAALKDPLQAVLLNVASGSHWVTGVERYPDNGLFKIADPWLGDWASTARYKNDITGAAYFKRI